MYKNRCFFHWFMVMQITCDITDCRGERERDRQTDRQTDIRTDRQTDGRQTGKQIDRQREVGAIRQINQVIHKRFL